MDSLPQPPPFEFGISDSFDALRSVVPPRLMALAAKGPVLLGLEAPTIVAAGLAHLAAAVGRSVLLDDGAYNLAPGFNLAVLDDTASSLEWLSGIGKGWLDQAVSLRSRTPDTARIVIRQYMQEAAVRPSRSKTSDPQIDQCLANIPENLVSMLRTQYIAHKTDPVTLASSLVHSSDHAVATVNGALNPFHEWSRLTPGKQHQLTEMLTMSWKGKPMEISTRGASVPASLTCLWQTHMLAMKEALGGKLATLARNPPPLLMFRQKGIPKRFPRVEDIESVAWLKCLEHAFGNRLHALTPAIVILEPELKQLAAVWFTQFDAALAKTPQLLQPWLNWLPDLVLRIYLVLLLSSSMHTMLSTIPTAPERQRLLSLKDKQKIMSDAIALTRWLAQEHFCAVQGLLGTDSLTFTDSTDMKMLEDGILQRLRDAGPLQPRELQRSFHALSAQTRDSAIQRLKSKGLVTADPDGVLRLVA
jgi:hypothetical protein